jgi:hypothetical protein
MLKRFLFAITICVPLFIGGLIGRALSLAPYRLMPEAPALLVSTVIFVIVLIVFIRSSKTLINIKIDISQVSGIFDKRLTPIYISIFFLGLFTINLVLYVSAILSYINN